MQPRILRHAPRLSLDPAASEQWEELSARTAAAATGAGPTDVNDALREAARESPEAATSPAYLLWSGESLVREGRDREALAVLEDATEVAASADRLLPQVDIARVSLHHRGEAAARIGETDLALASFRELADRSRDPAGPLFEAGLVAEEAGRRDDALELYRSAAAIADRSRSTDAPAELARRALRRLEDDGARFAGAVGDLADTLARALDGQDADTLRQLASSTHFAVGPAGGHLQFEDVEVVDQLIDELAGSEVQVRPALGGSGDKRYLFTEGWQGRLFRGQLALLLTRCAQGWQWTGVAVTEATDEWIARWRPSQRPDNQPLPFALLAPWPAGEHFMGGGLVEFGVKAAAVAAAGFPAGAVLAAGFATSRCGFGPRGFYYNEGPTHDEESAFAIDFTRYRRFVPFDNVSGGTPVLAPAAGVVVTACGGRASGDASASNTVEILHADPATGQGRYLSRYLHLAGPGRIPVSTGMAVRVGERLGVMDDTGNSALNHLHFSIHDQNQSFPGAGSGCGGITRGASVRPTPLNGTTLGDGASATCMQSSNAEVTVVGAAAGQVRMLRVHELGGGFGPDDDHIDAEVIVQLDSRPNESFGFQLRTDRELPSRQAMLTMLRGALANGTPVSIEYVRVGPSVRRAIRVVHTEDVAVDAAVGSVAMLRVHELGGGFGPDDDHIDAEVIVQLDSRPNESFGFRLRDDHPLPARRAMLTTLRDALAQAMPVRVEFVRAGPSVRRIMRVVPI